MSLPPPLPVLTGRGYGVRSGRGTVPIRSPYRTIPKPTMLRPFPHTMLHSLHMIQTRWTMLLNVLNIHTGNGIIWTHATALKTKTNQAFLSIKPFFAQIGHFSKFCNVCTWSLVLQPYENFAQSTSCMWKPLSGVCHLVKLMWALNRGNRQ